MLQLVRSKHETVGWKVSFQKICLCEGLAGQVCSCCSNMRPTHRLLPRATQGLLGLTLGSLHAGKTPIWAAGCCLTPSDNVVAGQEADPERVVAVPWHPRPPALPGASGVTLVKSCRLSWGTFELEKQQQHPTKMGLTNWQDLWYHGKGIIPAPLRSQLSRASALGQICDAEPSAVLFLLLPSVAASQPTAQPPQMC